MIYFDQLFVIKMINIGNGQRTKTSVREKEKQSFIQCVVASQANTAAFKILKTHFHSLFLSAQNFMAKEMWNMDNEYGK